MLNVSVTKALAVEGPEKALVKRNLVTWNASEAGAPFTGSPFIEPERAVVVLV